MKKMGIEISEKIKEKGASLIGEKVESAIKEIDKRAKDPIKKAVGESAQMTALSKFVEDAKLKEHAANYAKNQWKSVKALAAGVLAIIPLLGEVEGGSVASAELADAAILEGATAVEAAGLAGGKVVGVGGAVVETFGRLAANKTMEGVKKGLKAIDPFEDVPIGVTTAAGAAEMGGLHGALVVPALVQLAKNSYEMWSEIIGTGKDVYKALPDELKNRIKRAKSSEMAASAAAFA